MADASARIKHVASIPRDEVDVQVANGLTGGFPNVDADVVSVGRGGSGVELSLDLLYEVQQGLALFHRRVEPAGDQPMGHNQCVTGTHRIGIANCECEVVAREHTPK